eukprot:7330669-Pyramimonas_sp.AAC.2
MKKVYTDCAHTELNVRLQSDAVNAVNVWAVWVGWKWISEEAKPQANVLPSSDRNAFLFYQVANRAGDVAAAESRRGLMRSMWRERIRGVQRKVEVWQGLLAVRSLVLPMKEESDTWI